MAFTRTKYDDCRIIKQLQQSTDPGRWTMNVPGNGINMPLMEDPHIRIQKWGANLSASPVALEDALTGRDKILGKGDATRLTNIDGFSGTQYPSNQSLTTDQSRATNPAFLHRETTRSHLHFPLQNPQSHISQRNSVGTRFAAKDLHTEKAR
jgi:hypothetical protein